MIKLSKSIFIIGLPLALLGSHIYFNRPFDGDIKISEETKARWAKAITPDATDSADTEKTLKFLRKQLSDCAQNYQTQIQSEISNFKQELHTILDSGKSDAYKGINPTISYFTQLGNASALVKDLAFDEAKAEAIISAVVDTNISKHIISTEKQIEELLNDYTLRTQAIANRYTAELQGTIRKYRNTGIDSNVLQKIEISHAAAMKGLKETAKKNAIAATGVAINLAFDVACFKATKESAKSILKWAFKAAAKRAGTTAAVGGTAAAVDGPFPFGDILGLGIAIGGAVWTACDIYDAYTQIRNELPKSLKDGIDETLCVAEESALKRFDAWNAQLPGKITLQFNGKRK